MAGHPPPEPGKYRRIQAAYFLLRKGFIAFSQLGFTKEGRLLDLGLSKAKSVEYLKGGDAFRTSGCPDCNRPFFNEKPGGFIYNYPRPLTASEQAEAISCLATGLREEMNTIERKMAIDL